MTRDRLALIGLRCFLLPFISLGSVAASFVSPPPRSTYFVAVDGSDDGPGTINSPWATLSHAAEVAVAGDTVLIRGGHYKLTAQIRPRNSGRSDAWITFSGYPGKNVILDAEQIPSQPFDQRHLNNGAFQIEGISHVRVAHLTVINSHDAGITVRDSSDIELINNTTKGTFSSGIAVWDTNHDDRGTERIRVIGNTISRATTWGLAPADQPRHGEPPHEALSVGGAIDFEVAYNHILDGDKEGIVIKETSKRGKVHHNLVEHLARQGLYVGAYFGELSDIEIFSNVIHDCRGAGFVLSVEQGGPAERISFHNNLVFNNDGSGVYFSRWGAENVRRYITIENNVFYRNGYGKPNVGQTYFWQTGGIYLYSPRVSDVTIRHNILSGNRGFQIGFSELFLQNGRSWQTTASARNILINRNVIYGPNPVSPIESGGAPFDRVKIYAVRGNRAIVADPMFRDPAREDFTPRRTSPAQLGVVFAGAYPPGTPTIRWWRRSFPAKSLATVASPRP